MQLLAALYGHGITKEQIQVLAPVDNCCLEGSCSFFQPVGTSDLQATEQMLLYIIWAPYGLHASDYS